MRSEYGVYANRAAKYDDEPRLNYCPICEKNKLSSYDKDGFFLLEEIFIKIVCRKGYHRVCKKCFSSALVKNPDAKIYSGNPRPWLDRHLVLSDSNITEEIGWIMHDRKVILKQFKLEGK